MNPLAIGLPLQAGGAIINAYRSNKFMKSAQKSLDDLVANPIKPYSANNQLTGYASQARAEAAAPKGLSPAEVADFQQNAARTQATQFANASKIGGGRGILGILNANDSLANTRLAGMNANLINSNRLSAIGRMGSAASQFQNIDNMNVGANINAQQMLGGAIRQQRENIGRAFGSLSNAGGLLTGYGLSQINPSASTSDGISFLDRLKYRADGDPISGGPGLTPNILSPKSVDALNKSQFRGKDVGAGSFFSSPPDYDFRSSFLNYDNAMQG